MGKRVWIIMVVWLVLMAGLAVRVGYVQLAGHEELSEMAHIQQNINLEGADSRGTIYDRNGTPIAGQQQEYIYIIRGVDYDGETQNALNQVYAEEIPNKGSGYKVFASEIYRKSIGERLIKNSGAYILETGRRYQEQQPAVHMIGYTNKSDGSGASGLELMCDAELGELNKKIGAIADVQGNLLQGYGLSVSTNNESDSAMGGDVTTTLDLGLQLKTEEILRASAWDGAIVVVKAGSGEIMASASTPVFDPQNIEEYLESDGGELINKVTQGEYPPGSVFKIVVAAAALEAGIEAERRFNCMGSETVNGHTVKCATGGETGHGSITFTEAFADSCNCVFVQIGNIIGAEKILEMAERMGLGSIVLDDFPGEKDGNLMTMQQSEGAAIANLSIGQGETLVTPLQVSRLTAIVANDGIDTGLNIFLGSSVDDNRVISSETAGLLRMMMKATVETGTGKTLEMPVSAGAKTGSAEAVQGGQYVVHGWITGYIPAENPEYVITVFMENGQSGRASAGPVFQEVAGYLHETGMVEYEIGF